MAEIFDSLIKIDVSWFEHNYMKSSIVSTREFELDYFPNIRIIPKYSARLKILDKKLGIFQRRLSGKVQAKMLLLSEKNVANFSTKPRIIDGVFANKNFLPRVETLRELLKFPQDKSLWLTEKLNNLNDSFSVAVHIRMGDYLNLEDIYGVVDTNYYKLAMKSIRVRYPSAKFHLFSDSPKQALLWLNSEIDFYHVVETPEIISTGEVFRYMSSFNGLICANSTFSWWAGYVGSHWQNMKVVILPSKFSNVELDSVDKILKINGWEIF